MDQITWVEEEVVLIIHDEQIMTHGGYPGVRDINLLRSAMARPQNLAAYSDGDVDIFALAASYGFGIARNHPFQDANKRTAYMTTKLFLDLHNVVLTAEEDDTVETMVALASGDLPEDDFARWLKDNSEST